MIDSFRDKHTEDLWLHHRSAKIPSEILRKAVKQLKMLEFATSLDDLRIPPGNRLEKLTGDRKGQHSIRINHQWRVCFTWEDGAARHVEIVDYH
ncbi:type II toxin-antitoxin system RelE/ParE family toxin [Corynebacterium cystitidis]|uniref:type II toxin-antitoxin system RelE/ParE family toxin n=1 Tax=Corynebacterium cystitidis TaxID=35757 RepID=UPI00211E7970